MLRNDRLHAARAVRKGSWLAGASLGHCASLWPCSNRAQWHWRCA